MPPSFTCSERTTGRRSTGSRDNTLTQHTREEPDMQWHARWTAAAGAAACVAMTGAAPASAADVTLRMAVPDWPPTHIMKDLFDAQYKAASGNSVKLELDFIPWPDYYTRLNASLTSGEKKYNM